MIIDCISDLHGAFPELEGGDLLIVSGDVAANHSLEAYFNFFDWIYEQKYTKKIVISGNHDQFFQDEKYRGPKGNQFVYLCDSGTEFEGFKIWGSPWTKLFNGVNLNCTAFMVDSEKELAKKWEQIPADTDILVTHCPPRGILDMVFKYLWPGGDKRLISSFSHKGSDSLYRRILEVKPKLHVFGHVHESYGIERLCDYIFVNASHMNEMYDPVNKPIRIEI